MGTKVGLANMTVGTVWGLFLFFLFDPVKTRGLECRHRTQISSDGGAWKALPEGFL